MDFRMDYAIMIVIALMGLLMVALKKPLFIGSEKYTEESIKKYCVSAGVCVMLMGLSGFAFMYFLSHAFGSWQMAVSGIAVIIFIIANIVVTKKTLVKK